MTESESYILKLNLPARLLPWVHLIFGSACTFWLLMKLYGLGNSVSSSLGVVTAFLVGWVSFAGPLVAKVLSGPVAIEVKDEERVTFTNIFGTRTDLSFGDIISVSTHWYVLSIQTTSGEYITTNGFPDFERFMTDFNRYATVKSRVRNSAT